MDRLSGFEVEVPMMVFEAKIIHKLTSSGDSITTETTRRTSEMPSGSPDD